MIVKYAAKSPHNARIPFEILPCVADAPRSSQSIKHYTDPTVLAPILLNTNDQDADHNLVGTRL